MNNGPLDHDCGDESCQTCADYYAEHGVDLDELKGEEERTDRHFEKEGKR